MVQHYWHYNKLKWQKDIIKSEKNVCFNFFNFLIQLFYIQENDLLIKESQIVQQTKPLPIESSSSEDEFEQEEEDQFGSPSTRTEKIRVNVRLPNSSILKFNIDPVKKKKKKNFFNLLKNYKMEKLISGLSTKLGIEKKEIKLKFDGEILQSNEKMDIFEDDDLIELITKISIEPQLNLIFRFNKDHSEFKKKLN